MIRPFLLLLAIGLAAANPPPVFNCTGLNGVVWNACRSYGVCDQGRHQQIDCPIGTAFSRQRLDCVDIRQSDWPCSIEMRDCSAYPRTVHRLPEVEVGDGGLPCSWYYTCIHGRFVAHQPCTEGMVYSEQRQNCRYPQEVEEPCGPLPRGSESVNEDNPGSWPNNQNNNNNNNWNNFPNNNNNNNNNNWNSFPNNQNNFPRNNNNNNNWNSFPNNQNNNNNNNNWNNNNWNNPNTYPNNNNNNNNNNWDDFPGPSNNHDKSDSEGDNWDGGFGGFGYAGR